jgi:hypothetical protein
MQSESGNESRENEEQALITEQFKDIRRNKVSAHCKARRNHGNRQSDVNPQHPHCVYCRKTGRVKANFFIVHTRNEANGNGNNNVSTGFAEGTSDVVLIRYRRIRNFQKIC